MSLPSHQTVGNARNRAVAPTLIGVGLGLLIVAAWWPVAPVITAMAIVAFGTTDAMVSRFRDSAAALPIIVLHGMIYALLYALFVGARLHAPTAGPTPGLSSMAMLDLAASAFPMTVAISRILSCLGQSLLSRH